jgi:hypothetical protein
VHPIDKPTSNYIKLSSFLFTYPMGVCNVEHSDDGICKITSFVLCFLVDNTASGKIIYTT